MTSLLSKQLSLSWNNGSSLMISYAGRVMGAILGGSPYVGVEIVFTHQENRFGLYCTGTT